MGLAARIETLEGELAAVVQRLEALEFQVQGPAAATSTDGAPDSSAGASPAASPAAAAPPVSARRSGLDSFVKHYVVTSGNGLSENQQGLYASYTTFSDAVRDHSVSWNGRGCLPWARGAHGRSFNTRRLAEDFYREQFDLGPDAEVPRRD